MSTGVEMVPMKVHIPLRQTKSSDGRVARGHCEEEGAKGGEIGVADGEGVVWQDGYNSAHKRAFVL